MQRLEEGQREAHRRLVILEATLHASAATAAANVALATPPQLPDFPATSMEEFEAAAVL